MPQSTPHKRTLLQDQESTTKKPKAAAARRLYTDDNRVSQKLRQNFAKWNDHLTDGVKFEGLTLRQRLASDVVRCPRFPGAPVD